jgi:hypothetical protein
MGVGRETPARPLSIPARPAYQVLAFTGLLESQGAVSGTFRRAERRPRTAQYRNSETPNSLAAGAELI